MNRREATVVAADIAGYSRLMALDEAGVIDRLREVRQTHVQPVLDARGGRIIKTMGDGLLVEFPDPASAVRAACDVQNAMVAAGRDSAPDRRMLFRVGINHGTIVEDDDEILGDVINIARGLKALPLPGASASREASTEGAARCRGCD